MREVLSLWVDELGDRVRVHARSEAADVHLVEARDVTEEGLRARAVHRVVPHHHVAVQQLEVVDVLRG